MSNRFKYVWENISDPAIHDTMTGKCYFIDEENDIEDIVSLLNGFDRQIKMFPPKVREIWLD